MNFRNQRPRITTDYTIIMSRKLKVTGYPIKFARFVLLSVSEETKTWLPFFCSWTKKNGSHVFVSSLTESNIKRANLICTTSVDAVRTPNTANRVGTWPTISGPPYQTPTYNLRPRLPYAYQTPTYHIRPRSYRSGLTVLCRIYPFYLIYVSTVVPSNTVRQ